MTDDEKAAARAADTCKTCGSRLFFSARQSGTGLCGPCQRGEPPRPDPDLDAPPTRADVVIAAIEVARRATLMSPSNDGRIPGPGDLVVEVTIRHDMEGICEVVDWPTPNGDGAITRALFPAAGRPGTQRWRNAEFRVIADPLATLLRMIARIIPCEEIVFEARRDELDTIDVHPDRERGK